MHPRHLGVVEASSSFRNLVGAAVGLASGRSSPYQLLVSPAIATPVRGLNVAGVDMKAMQESVRGDEEAVFPGEVGDVAADELSATRRSTKGPPEAFHIPEHQVAV